MPIVQKVTKFRGISVSGLETNIKVKSVPVTGLGWPRGFQEVKVPRFLDNGTG
jgi:hypothetical protein